VILYIKQEPRSIRQFGLVEEDRVRVRLDPFMPQFHPLWCVLQIAQQHLHKLVEDRHPVTTVHDQEIHITGGSRLPPRQRTVQRHSQQPLAQAGLHSASNRSSKGRTSS